MTEDTDRRKALEARFASLSEAYVAGLPQRFVALDGTLMQDDGSGVSLGNLQRLRRLAHTLAGSAETFGLRELGGRARALEAAALSGAADPRSLATLLERCKQADRTPRAAATPALEETEAGSFAAPEILVLEADRATGEELAGQLDYFGFRTRVLNDRRDLAESLNGTRTKAVIADIAYVEDGGDGARGIGALHAAGVLSAPVVFLSEHDEFHDRLSAVQAGGAAYLTRPFDIVPLVDRLDVLTGQERDAAYRVLVVDDDVDVGHYHAAVLASGGIDTRVCDTPSAVPAVLAEFRPDLVLLDLHMPQCSGADLAAVIRQLEGFLTMPIVFLSGEGDARRRLGAMGRGGDDFISKPVVEEHLLAGVNLRVARARQIACLAERDGLTGLLKHTSIKEALSREMNNARRGNYPCAFVLLDIDWFKKVNDAYGHLAGDRVIKSLARLLRSRLRETDWIGRYGGEEFAIVLPHCSAAPARALVEEIARRFRAVRHQGAPGVDFAATFSAGIAECRSVDTVDTMIHAADCALYEAKRDGRDCVRVGSAAE